MVSKSARTRRSGICAAGSRELDGSESRARLLRHMIDGNRVHFENNACLIRHGDRWRDAATRALEDMGLRCHG